MKHFEVVLSVLVIFNSGVKMEAEVSKVKLISKHLEEMLITEDCF